MPFDLTNLCNVDSQLLKLLTENLPDMLWIKDTKGVYIYANKALCDGLLMAKDTNEPIGKTDIYFAKREREAHSENPKWHTFGELCFNSDQLVIDANKQMKFEEWGNVKGKLLYLEVNKAPFYDKEGNIIGTVGSGRDITELKMTQFKLAKQAQIIDQIHDSIITVGLDGEIISWNKGSEILFEYKSEEAINTNIQKLFCEQCFEDIKSATIENGKYLDMTTEFLTKSKRKILCDLTVSLMHDSQDKHNGYIYYIKDITEKEMMNNELKKQSAIISSQANHVSMGSMIANIAHQWRQPLAIINTTASGIILQKEMNILDDQFLIDSLEKIIKNTDYLAETITTFRNFLKDGKKTEIIHIQSMLDNTLKIIDTVVRDNHITLKAQIENTEPLYKQMVTGELSQVIINIINNAKDILLEKKVKNPWIELKLFSDEKNIYITIEDNGGGIPLEIMPKIFEAYFTTKGDKDGTGLGLNMSYRIVKESLKGDLQATNSSNGALFKIIFPKD
ncbi:MAG: PAS domain S-box protein [Campylobacterales bacterium]|nr:PAS domain S-box protein [Campylobacterales bacterium]